MQPDRERHIGRGEAMEQVGAGARIVSPVRQHVIERTTRLGGSAPGPRFRQDIRGFRQRDRTVACRRTNDAERVAQGHFRRSGPYGQEPANRRGGAQMMYAIAREVLGRQESERQFPGGFVGGVNREHLDLQARLDQRSHARPRGLAQHDRRSGQRRGQQPLQLADVALPDHRQAEEDRDEQRGLGHHARSDVGAIDDFAHGDRVGVVQGGAEHEQPQQRLGRAGEDVEVVVAQLAQLGLGGGRHAAEQATERVAGEHRRPLSRAGGPRDAGRGHRRSSLLPRSRGRSPRRRPPRGWRPRDARAGARARPPRPAGRDP